MQLFDDILNLYKKIEEKDQQQEYIGLFIGKVCFVRDSDKAVKVTPIGANTSYTTFWLTPTGYAKYVDVSVTDYVVYCYPTLNPNSGIYLDYINKNIDLDSGGLTPESVQELIDNSIADYDILIKAFISSQNYTTLAAVQTWVNSQNFVTNTSLTSTLTNYVTNTSLSSALASYVTTSTLTSVLTSYVTNTALTALLANYATLVSSKQSRVNSFRYIKSVSLTNGGGDFAAINDWMNCVTSFMVTGVSGRTPPPIGLSPTPVDHTNAKYRIFVNSTTNGNMATGDEFYFRIDTQYRHYVVATAPVTVNGSSGAETTMNPRECWRLLKTAGNTYTLTNMNDFYYNPY